MGWGPMTNARKRGRRRLSAHPLGNSTRRKKKMPGRDREKKRETEILFKKTTINAIYGFEYDIGY